MSFTNFTLDIGTDSVAVVTWNMPGRLFSKARRVINYT